MSEFVTILPPPDMYAGDFTRVIQFYSKWFTVDFTPPQPNDQIQADQFNAFRQAVSDGAAAMGYSIPNLPNAVAPGDVIRPTDWYAPIKSN